MGAVRGLGKHIELIGAVRARWGTISRRCGPAVDDRSSRVPCDLESIIRAIEVFPSAESNGTAGHLRHGVSLRELLDDFAQLRRLILEEVSDHLVRPMKLDEMLCLNGALDHLTAAVVTHSVANHSLRIEKAVEGQNAFLFQLGHDLRGQLNGILLTLQVLQRELSGVSSAGESLAELEQLRRAILTTIQKMDQVGRLPREMPLQPEGSARTH